MSKGKVIVGIVALAVVGAAVAFIVLRDSGATEVSVAEAARGDLVVTVSASGEVQADAKADIYPPTAGTLQSIEVIDGQAVVAGQVIAIMDTAPIEAQVAQAEAAYAGAQAQRAAVTKAVPSDEDEKAAQAAVNAAWSAYQLALAQYEAAKAGYGAPTDADIAQAEAAVATAQVAYDAANAAYESFYTNVYLPAPEPRDPALETALAALALARDQALAYLRTAQNSLEALLAAQNNDAAVAVAKAAKDQAYAAYLAAVSQQEALAKASSIGSALDSADAAIAAAEEALSLAERTLDRATLVAPFDGTVVFNSVSGAILGGPVIKPVPGSSVSPAAAPFTVVAFDQLAFNAQVDEADIATVEPGMRAVVSLDALPEREFETTVERVDAQSVLTPTGGTAFPVVLRLTGGQDDVLLGMNGSVAIEIETLPEAVTVPVEAVLERDGVNYVYVVEDDTAVFTEVEIGRLTDTAAEVLSGLNEGDQVITSGVSDLTDGARVKVE